jgi:gliding motility-associated-like protein
VDSVLITLAVSNDLCADSDTVMVPSIVSNLFFPNIFTPTLTSNNTFKAIGNGIADFEIWIYDRRGDIVFHSTDIDQPWDGTHDGAPCPQAAYVYKCRYSTTLEPQSFKTVTRTVTLIR